jgi:hypothetical protein
MLEWKTRLVILLVFAAIAATALGSYIRLPFNYGW